MSVPSVATGLASKVILNDGHWMPQFGLGMFRQVDGCNNATAALKHGYRLLDTAEYYQNEGDVGQAIKNSGVPRGDIFVVSKLWAHGTEACRSHFLESLKQLGLDYLDLYLIHSPHEGKLVETYNEMVQLQKQGLVRSIGVSNFGVHHIRGLIDAGLPVPAVNQIELHPWQQKRDIVKFCRETGLTVMGYSPLTKGKFIDDEKLLEIAKRYNKTPAQVLIRWSVQSGFITIPKSSRPERILENSFVFDWSINQEDMEFMNNFPEKSCAWNPCVSPWEG